MVIAFSLKGIESPFIGALFKTGLKISEKAENSSHKGRKRAV
jgi:hypothetical protein